MQLLLQPTGKRRLHGFQLTREKVIGAGKEHRGFGFGGGAHNLRPLCGGRVLVLVSADKEFGNCAIGQGGIGVIASLRVRRKAEGDQGAHARTGPGFVLPATGSQRHGSAKAESSHHYRAIVCVFKPVQSSQYVADFRFAIVAALAQPSAPKIEAKHGQTQSPGRIVHGFHGVVNHFVVHGAAAQRVRMT